jgi:hypothetical protein
MIAAHGPFGCASPAEAIAAKSTTAISPAIEKRNERIAYPHGARGTDQSLLVRLTLARQSWNSMRRTTAIRR